MDILIAVLVSLVAAISLFVFLVVTIGYLLSCKPYKGPVSDHFDGNKFINPSRRPANGFKQVGEYGRTRQPDKWKRVQDPDYKTRQIPVPDPDTIQYTFINHSTFLIQWQGINILTDPIWSERCSPFQWAGPRRMRPPGIAFDNIPPVHLVLLSHNHYDHLDKATVKRIAKRDNPTFVTALGLEPILRKYGCQKVETLDWWGEIQFEGMRITATPANHFSSRGIFDRDKTLWSGFVLELEGKKIYYAGDTGYSDVFKEIGQRCGPMDLSFIPMGAYMPKWFMSPIHISPDQALLVHDDVQSQKSVAMHFGTFPLADDNPERSIREMTTYRKEAGISEDTFSIPVEGRACNV